MDNITARNVWIKVFWGFAPVDHGYIGFTREADRDNLINQVSKDDLILIYGADSAETENEDRRQALGFIQIDPVPIMYDERISERGRSIKIAKGWEDRWIYAAPVKRAWEVKRKVEIKHLAPVTYNHRYARIIASQGKCLTPQEAEIVKQLPVTRVNVYGEPPISEDELKTEKKMGDAFTPSKGIKPVFGSRTSIYEDGEHCLYMFRFTGDMLAILGKKYSGRRNEVLVKVGYSNDPKRRCEELNNGFPPDSICGWSFWRKSGAFGNGSSAEESEGKMKMDFASRFTSLGGEFFIGRESELESAFASAASSTAFIIKV